MKVQYAKIDEASRETVDVQQGKGQSKVDLFGQQRGGILYPGSRTMDRRRGDDDEDGRMGSRRGDDY